jgi:lysozyme family protein
MGDLIDDIIRREDPAGTIVNDPADRGGRTKFGISERSNPDAWKDGDVSHAEARAIYETKYLKGPGFDKITHPRLRDILVDFGVTSGPQLAIMKLQEILKTEVDGVLGPKTLTAIETWEPRRLVNKIALARVQMAGRIVKRDPSQIKWLGGWLNRFSEFVD